MTLSNTFLPLYQKQTQILETMETTNINTAKEWFSSLSITEQNELADKHLLSFERAALIGNTAQYNSVKGWETLILKLWTLSNPQLPAYYVKAKVDGKSWLTKCTALTATDAAHAIQKATEILKLTPEHVVDVEAVTVYNTSAKLETDSYPYGRLKSTAYFSVEYNAKGARSVFQTIDPKSGRLNKPKHSTYSRVVLPMQLSNGHFDFCGWLDFNGTEELNKALYFMADFAELFTIEQIKSVAVDLIAMTKVNVKATCMYGGSKLDDLKSLVTEQINTLCEIANTGENKFISCLFDLEAINATKPENYQPFTVTNYGV